MRDFVGTLRGDRPSHSESVDDAFDRLPLSDWSFHSDATAARSFAPASRPLLDAADNDDWSDNRAQLDDVATAARPLTDSIDWGTRVEGSAFTIYFARAGESYDGRTVPVNWTDEEKAAVMAAWGTYSDVANITFSVTGIQANATFTLVKADLGPDSLAYFNPPGEHQAGLGVFNYLDPSWTTDELNPGGYAFLTLIHEFGHALGLAHPHDDGGTSSIMRGVTAPFDSYGDFDLNQGVFTVMSYNDGWPRGPYSSGNMGYSSTPGPIDIAVIQAKYGINPDHNADDTIYEIPRGHSTSHIAIWDTGGVDTIVQNFYANSVIDLRTATLRYAEGGGGYVSYSSGSLGGITIANGVVIENAIGGWGRDTIIGNAADNQLTGRSGNDYLDGGDGIDTAIFSGREADYLITYNDDGTITVSDIYQLSRDGTDTLVNIEVLQFLVPGGLTLTGDALGNTLEGTASEDTLDGAGGDDRLFGFAGDDYLFGGEGDDVLNGGAGIDALDGGTGRDVADYQTSQIAVNVNLALGTGANGDAQGDRLTGIEDLIGSTKSDILTGDAGANMLSGLAGNDSLDGGDGEDTLIGGAGRDTLIGGRGIDLADYSTSTDGVTVNLLTGTGDGGDATGDQLTGIEDLLGSSFNDVLTGNSAANRLTGGAGTDTLYGGSGHDTLYGGNDADQLNGDAGNDVIYGEHGHDIARGGDGNDQIFGGIGRDNLYGDDGDDILDGGDGADRLFGGLGDDNLDGGDGDDLIAGNEGHDIARGGEGNDRMLGGAGRDNLYGEAGHDTLIGEDGGDRMFGGLGNDDLDGGDGVDHLVGNEGHDVLHGGNDNDRLFGNDGRDQLYGDAGNDGLWGGNGADSLYGGDGRDTLDGGDANDSLFGGTGADKLTGGAGNDLIDGGAGTDTAFYSGNYADYAIVISGSTATITGPDGTDTLTSIERLQFADQLVRLVLAPASSAEAVDAVGSPGPAEGFSKSTAPVMGALQPDEAGPHLPAFQGLNDDGVGFVSGGLAHLTDADFIRQGWAEMIDAAETSPLPDETHDAMMIPLTEANQDLGPALIAHAAPPAPHGLEFDPIFQEAPTEMTGFAPVEGWH